MKMKNIIDELRKKESNKFEEQSNNEYQGTLMNDNFRKEKENYEEYIKSLKSKIDNLE